MVKDPKRNDTLSKVWQKLLSINQDISNPIPILSQVGEVVTRLAHNQKIGGANPSPATKKLNGLSLITG